ncbi:hypothetical protein ABT336_14475 [Micromonospora sp. NPDC000207]|uniref:hypothetical protein n=1 Tax=Micromonospora sp. NPDC000207 TaxID=3154246 RepID=UPI00332441AE
MTAAALVESPTGTPPPLPPVPPPPTGHAYPTCGRPTPGLLALCWKPVCLTAYLNEDARYDD